MCCPEGKIFRSLRRTPFVVCHNLDEYARLVQERDVDFRAYAVVVYHREDFAPASLPRSFALKYALAHQIRGMPLQQRCCKLLLKYRQIAFFEYLFFSNEFRNQVKVQFQQQQQTRMTNDDKICLSKISTEKVSSEMRRAVIL